MVGVIVTFGGRVEQAKKKPPIQNVRPDVEILSTLHMRKLAASEMYRRKKVTLQLTHA